MSDYKVTRYEWKVNWVRLVILAGVVYLVWVASSMDNSINDVSDRLDRVEGLLENPATLTDSTQSE